MFMFVLLCCFFAGIKAHDSPGGWELVFRGLRGNGVSVYDTWATSSNVRKFSDGCDNIYEYPGKNHFRSPAIDEWEIADIEQVKVELYKDSSRVAYIVFNGTDSNKFNWFHQSRILVSSWDDLTVDATYNYFSIAGHPPRRFFINEQYGGCPNDLGWLIVIESDTFSCSWDSQPSFPAFLYAMGTTKTSWHFEEYGHADILAVFIKYDD